MVGKLIKQWGPHAPGAHVATSEADAKERGIEAWVPVDQLRWDQLVRDKYVKPLHAAPAAGEAPAAAPRTAGQKVKPGETEAPAAPAGEEGGTDGR